MERFLITLEVEEEELGSVLRELQEARETIYRCYSRLEEMGAIRVVRKNTEAARED